MLQMYVAFKCFMLQVQTASIGIHEGGQGQVAATDAQRRCCCGRGGGKSSGWPRRDGRRAGVGRGGASHLSSVGSGSEADGLDASAGNRAGVDSARIRADRVEQS
jgi:hypothetical protein